MIRYQVKSNYFWPRTKNKTKRGTFRSITTSQWVAITNHVPSVPEIKKNYDISISPFYNHYGNPSSGCGVSWSSNTGDWAGKPAPGKHCCLFLTMAAEIHSRPQTARPVLLNKIEGHTDAVNAAVLIPKEDGVITVSEDRWAAANGSVTKVASGIRLFTGQYTQSG